HVELELHAGDFFALQLDHPADPMLGINDVIADIECGGIHSHLAYLSFLAAGFGERVAKAGNRTTHGRPGWLRFQRCWRGPAFLSPTNRPADGRSRPII